MRAGRETGEASEANWERETGNRKPGQGDQLPAVLPNPLNFGIVAMLPCAVRDESGTKGALGTNGTNREKPVDTARKT
ncbi:hypothetical protein GCM10010435_66240 [Winogradskya consettensis]